MRRFVIVTGLAIGTIGLASIAWTQDATTKKSTATSEQETLPPGAERTSSGKIVYRGRLPNNWGKLGVLYEQKQKIYKVQAEYNHKINELEKQIEQLRSERDSAMRAALSEAQQKKLDEIIAGK